MKSSHDAGGKIKIIICKGNFFAAQKEILLKSLCDEILKDLEESLHIWQSDNLTKLLLSTMNLVINTNQKS